MEQSQASYEASVSINLGLAQGSSFLDDICECFWFSSLPAVKLNAVFQLVFLFTIPYSSQR